MKNRKISELSIRRIILYYRYIHYLYKHNRKAILSEDIANYYNIEPSQVRKDFSSIGQMGKRGFGYNILKLMKDIERMLQLDSPINAIIIGCGKLGTALMGYPILKEEFNFNIIRGFDVDKRVVHTKINDIRVDDYKDVEKFIKKNDVTVAIVAVPRDSARMVLDQLKSYGIKGILNFSPIFVHFDEKVYIKNVDFSVDFNIFRYRMIKENLL